jgi:hypothetical protein
MKQENKHSNISIECGKTTYTFAKVLCHRLQFRKIRLGEIISLSDCLDFKVYRIFNFEQLNK